ncbi:MAG: DNA-directed RNA polymerase subunit alpha [Candidatus Zambryskibacteria bacterium RIFCSPLOWO2_12_FULL_39_45]|uniref:DNA-directed RNA polymerase subunit alpha n=3 Tax=Candidatus Zambryskiibacteriota TaxID=1817925 RepID=A0A1G2T794_9BACT|nr:MAG: DNA-directed RNA polymerase subunit alpha [Parcubacteria group bacterium GW2011_GWA2_40_14]OHA92898.1 MAG: DNA-directed RNA polymerase subunit alpha [Candidatus Zambryskibacteria bacterium RIFCSPHIGHO2_02_38_10.5]OHA96219.1 MAG: DNA-directed RNA polymerase subunit alpha [Candidatus Zambryskibacteria bacterium RIFCSPHIGHO2_02_FULL_39_82]OHA98427.1 MAG: DNA-directed RNA polymerase subunit alpha [Candidatus Zambryskibacteria bacterium RIFCSPHIGHO2_12_FULL_38_37]OHB08723.1 MAG: DNA-directed
MSDYTIVLPSKPKIVSEVNFTGSYEIDGLYPGYGHTLGNSLRRIILSSLPGAAITGVKITGIDHEFSVMPHIKEDSITILLNLKKIRLNMVSDEPILLSLKAKGIREVTAGDIKIPGGIEILNPELIIATLTDKNADLDMEITAEKGLGFISKEILQKNRVDIGQITLDAIFTPIRRVSYEVENMRVGDRTDFNRLKIFIETDGTITPKKALEKSIETMISQLKAIIGFKEEDALSAIIPDEEKTAEVHLDDDSLKTRIETLNLSSRTSNALANANIRTVGGLARKKEKDILEIEGLGAKGLSEIKEMLSTFGITLK